LNPSRTVEAVVRRDRLIVIGGLAVVVAVAWLYILAGAGMGTSARDMTSSVGGAAMSAMQPMAWTAGTAVIMFFMWWIMMIAMMLPSAAPMILLFATVNRKAAERGRPYVPTGAFAAGYLLMWGGFSVFATALQWGLEKTGLLTSMMASASPVLAGILLIAAGAWQLTPLKQACLRHCRSPLHFVTHRWRRGRLGALRMGFEHGAFCLGCCWFLMGLLFYGGVMNLYWIAGLAVFVLLEKTIPAGHWFGRVTGGGLAVWGGLYDGAGPVVRR
jgi:predicted metal-binding membrane protein